jgi:hypothetical protein
MADSKITALDNLTTADPANDMIPIVDVSATPPASGNTKRISINNLLACSPSATLASATITGDLTVDTSTLKVDSANNRVGIGTASPAYLLDVLAAGAITATSSFAMARITGASAVANDLTLVGPNTSQVRINFGDTDLASVGEVGYDHSTNRMRFVTNNQQQHTIDPNGVFNWYDGAGGTRMTLNANGLGVGAGPSYRFHVQQTLAGTASAVNPIAYIVNNGSGNTAKLTLSDAVTTDGNITLTGSATAANRLLGFGINGVQQMVLDGNGNVGIGVTPSAWSSIYKVYQIGQSASVSGGSSVELAVFGSNCYFDTTDSRWERITSGFTSQYYQTNGTHVWRIGGTAAANTDCSFTNVMTLDASGNLLVGTTGLNATWNTRLTLSSDSGTTRWAVGPYSTATNFVISGASGGGVYLNGTAATSWTSASDERLKDIIEPISNAVSKIGSLRSVIGKFKTDSEGTRRSFLIAQDVQSVLPEAVDASNPDRLGVAYTDVIPLLVAAIKELTARVQTLEAK